MKHERSVRKGSDKKQLFWEKQTGRKMRARAEVEEKESESEI